MCSFQIQLITRGGRYPINVCSALQTNKREDPEAIIKKYLPYPYGALYFWDIRSCIKRIPREKWWQFTVTLWKPGDLQVDGSYAEMLNTLEIETFYETFSDDRQL